MCINEIKDKEVILKLSSDELTELHNAMFFYEQHRKEYDKSEPSVRFNELYAQIIMARDISLYGHLDDFALSVVVKHKIEAYGKTHPEKDWIKEHLEIVEEQEDDHDK